MPNASCPPTWIITTTKSASAIALRRSVVAQTFAGNLLSLIMRPTNASIRRSFVSVGDMSANSLSCSAGVARMSEINVLQKTTLPAPIMAIFLGMGHSSDNGRGIVQNGLANIPPGFVIRFQPMPQTIDYASPSARKNRRGGYALIVVINLLAFSASCWVFAVGVSRDAWAESICIVVGGSLVFCELLICGMPTAFYVSRQRSVLTPAARRVLIALAI